jgi:hypothetical protein
MLFGLNFNFLTTHFINTSKGFCCIAPVAEFVSMNCSLFRSIGSDILGTDSLTQNN